MFNAASPATVGRLPPTVSGFSCHFTLDQGAARVGAEGELDVANEARFAAVLSRCQAEAALVVVDLRALEFLSCGGLRALVNATRRARATGGRLVVVHGPGAVGRLFEIVDVTFEIELVDRPPPRLPPPRCWRGEAA